MVYMVASRVCDQVEIGGIMTMKTLKIVGNSGLKHMLPTYLHEDPKICIFILKVGVRAS